jgi:hypothetical protein
MPMLCRFPLLIMLWLVGALTAAAPGLADPRPGTLAGLDLSSPEHAATSFVRAWSEGDYFVAYFALDPTLRFRFLDAILTFNMTGIFEEQPPVGFFERKATLTTEDARPGGTPGVLPDLIAEFDGFMRTAQALGMPILSFDAAAMGALTAGPGQGQDASLARVAVPSEAGGGILVLRRSGAGRWRLVGIEKRAVTPLWQFQPIPQPQ